MNAPRRLKVYILLGPPDEPIRGELEAPSGELTAFSGWIGLVAAIEAARRPAPVKAQPTAAGDRPRETAADQEDAPTQKDRSSEVNPVMDR
jgi:hypothetical protein